MKKAVNFLIEKRIYILIFMLIITSICTFAMKKVSINKDITKYLPSNSSMKEGILILEKELPDLKNMSTIWVMVDNLDDNQKINVYKELTKIKNIYTVSYEQESDTYNKDNHTLYILTSKYNFESNEIKEIKKELNDLAKSYNLVYELDSDVTNVPTLILIFTFSILLIILLIMCSSWIEPILFIITIGIAIIINFETNYLLKEVSYTTYSITAILQLVLTMDYSIMLLNRYREEKGKQNNTTAMKEAIKKSFPSIIGSSFTTIVGLLALLFMSFKIGTDLGIVLAKGVLISLICIFTILPSLILIFDKLIYKTQKNYPHINMNNIALKYCNSKFAYNGVCNSSSAWAMSANDHKIITGGTEITNCIQVSESTACGYNNSLLDNGGFYWFASANTGTPTGVFEFGAEHRRVGYYDSNLPLGVRPVIRLDNSVIVTGGIGTASNPYTIDTNVERSETVIEGEETSPTIPMG